MTQAPKIDRSSHFVLGNNNQRIKLFLIYYYRIIVHFYDEDEFLVGNSAY